MVVNNIDESNIISKERCKYGMYMIQYSVWYDSDLANCCVQHIINLFDWSWASGTCLGGILGHKL